MVALRNLNSICSNRLVAKAIPAQIACRLLGNSANPCKLDGLCKISEKTGVWSFYTIILAILTVVFFLVFWALRITRASKLISLLAKIVIPPFKWLSYSFASLYKFYKNLPF